MSNLLNRQFIDSFRALAEDIHDTAKSKGWWENADADFLMSIADCDNLSEDDCGKLIDLAQKLRERNDGEMLALIHSEVSEVLEGLRHGNPADDKVPEFSAAEAELADIVIRVMDMAHKRGWRVAEAIIAKSEMNKTRPFRHGDKRF